MRVTVIQNNQEKSYECAGSMNLLRFLQQEGYRSPESPCGGRGTCRKCKVRIELGRQKMMPLACQIRTANGMRITLPDTQEHQIREDGEHVAYLPDAGAAGIAAACDIGTTTVVCHLVDLAAGEKLATVSAPNAQRLFGADVIARIQAAAEGRLEEEQKAIVGQLNEMLAELKKRTGREESVTHLAVAGNTVMCHLLAGLSPESIGKAPFRPLSTFGIWADGKSIGLAEGCPVYIAPAVAGYVGGDITSDLLAVGAEREEGKLLLIDIGTNGEMVLKTQDGYLTCATAAGPAFEGACIEKGMPAMTGAVNRVWVTGTGEAAELHYEVIGGGEALGICGSGLVDLLAALRKLAIIDETGCFADEDRESYPISKQVYLTQADIRQLQLAKAAIAAGIRVLLAESGTDISEIRTLLLAGGFGSCLNPQNACAIGLLPEALLPAARAAGNTAGEGAVLAAISQEARGDLAEIRDKCRYLELSTHPAFSNYYIDEMTFS